MVTDKKDSHSNSFVLCKNYPIFKSESTEHWKNLSPSFFNKNPFFPSLIDFGLGLAGLGLLSFPPQRVTQKAQDNVINVQHWNMHLAFSQESLKHPISNTYIYINTQFTGIIWLEMEIDKIIYTFLLLNSYRYPSFQALIVVKVVC